MKSRIKLLKGNYVFQSGYPILLAAAYEFSKDNHIAEIWRLNANYNSDKTTVKYGYASINGLIKGGMNIDEALSVALDYYKDQYEETLYDSKEELIIRSLPLRFDTKPSTMVLRLIPNIEDLRKEMAKKTENDDVIKYLSDIDPLHFDFKEK